MTEIILDNIILKVDLIQTQEFYKGKDTFLCDCKDCVNYLSKIDTVKDIFDGLDIKLGVDLTRDVGINSDELMPHDYDYHHLYVIPYYIFGDFFVKKRGLISKSYEEVLYKINDDISVKFIEASYLKHINEKIITMWVEFKTPLVKIINKNHENKYT
jgi:hypothetical protein